MALKTDVAKFEDGRYFWAIQTLPPYENTSQFCKFFLQFVHMVMSDWLEGPR